LICIKENFERRGVAYVTGDDVLSTGSLLALT